MEYKAKMTFGYVFFSDREKIDLYFSQAMDTPSGRKFLKERDERLWAQSWGKMKVIKTDNGFRLK